jgi:hypothetical protein
MSDVIQLDLQTSASEAQMCVSEQVGVCVWACFIVDSVLCSCVQLHGAEIFIPQSSFTAGK